jgi:putative nucleotidyltransferase with HDIG domain
MFLFRMTASGVGRAKEKARFPPLKAAFARVREFRAPPLYPDPDREYSPDFLQTAAPFAFAGSGDTGSGMPYPTPRPLSPGALPPLVFSPDPSWPVPGREECAALWDRYAMPPHIRDHSRLVADFAVLLAERARELGARIHVPSALAAGLLHDLGKLYAIDHGGSHAQIGAAWVMAETRNPHIAQGVARHVCWDWEIDLQQEAWLPWFCLIYADKRVMHDTVVSARERYEDIRARYGHTPEARERIAAAHRQGLEIEKALSLCLRMDLHECTFDRGRLVQRT